MIDDDRDGVHENDAAYVLGGLSADERVEFERHLETCATCRASVAELAGLPAILRLLPADDAERAAETSTEQEPRVPAPHGARSWRPSRRLLPGRRPVAGRRSLSSRRLLAAGLVALAVVLAGGGYALGAQLTRSGAPVAARPFASGASAPHFTPMTSMVGGAVTADLAVTATSWGTRFDWNCSYARDAGATGVYDLVVEQIDGSRTVVATWENAPGGADGLAASSRLPLDRLRSVEITTADSRTVLTRIEL